MNSGLRAFIFVALTVSVSCSDAGIPSYRKYGAWESSKLGGGGFLQRVAYSPADSNRLYMASDVGGLFRTDDGGRTWRMVLDAFPFPDGIGACAQVRGVVAHPSRRDSVLVAVGDGLNAASGIYRSDDGGVTFEKTVDALFYGNEPMRVAGTILVGAPDGSERVYACPPVSGPMVSDDFGRAWRSLGLNGVCARDFVVDRTNARRMWLIADKRQNCEGGIYRSEDGGETWKRVASDVYPLEMVQDPKCPEILHGVFPTEIPQLRRSIDGGATWKPYANPEINPPPKSPWCDGIYHALAVGPDFILAAANGGTIYRLSAGNDEWKRLPIPEINDRGWFSARSPALGTRFGAALGFIGVSPHCPDDWVFTDWYACYRSHDAGRRWDLSVDGVEMTVVLTLAQDPSASNRVHVGMADIGYLRSDDGAESFGNWGYYHHAPNNVKSLSVCAAEPRRVYAVGPDRWKAIANRVYRSDDGGNTWTCPARSGLPDMPEDGGRRCVSIVVRPNRCDEVYLTVSGNTGVGRGGVYRSLNGGADWEFYGEGLPSDGGFQDSIWGCGSELAVSSSGTLVAAQHGSGRVFRRSAEDSAWQNVLLPGKSYDIVADSGLEERFYCSRIGDGLWRSDDGGENWFRVMPGHVRSIAVDAAQAGRVAVTDGNQYFVSANGGDNWIRLSGAPPNRSCHNVICFAGERLIVGTCGNGVFRINIPKPPKIESPWKFQRDRTGMLDASGEFFDDSRWIDVRVPHDWAISGPFEPDAKDGGTGKLPWRGVGWYRHRFRLSQDEAKMLKEGGQFYIKFDGVMARAEVWLNGKRIGGWRYGYTPFVLCAATAVRPEDANVLAVRVDTRDHYSRWYPGAGIYRDVRFVVKPKSHMVPGSLVVTTPKISRESAEVSFSWVNSEKGLMNRRHVVKNPRFWDVENPYLYGADIDGEKVHYGIRSFEWTATDGFHLNGRRVQIKGINLHSDLGPLGMAFDRGAARRQLLMMKQMGANALRTSHNPPAKEVLDICDELGILVWDECFDKWDGTSGRRCKEEQLVDYVNENLRAMVRRDRNHPCVVAWSISNEIGLETTFDPKAWWACGLTGDRCAMFRETVLQEDSTRPVCNGNIGHVIKNGGLKKHVFDSLDLTGWNYCGHYRMMKQAYPNKPVVCSESASAMSSRGFYVNPPPTNLHHYAKANRQVDSYDLNAGPDIPDADFRRMEEDPWCAGEFVWTGFDYLGEPSPYDKESRSSYFGIVDLMGVPKDRYWLYRSHWLPRKTTLHVLPHWTWPGHEGREVPVFVYTNGDSAELFLNGVSQGMRQKGVRPPDCPETRASYYDVMDRYRLQWWKVAYQPGEIKVVAYDKGSVIGERTVRTAGCPVSLKMVCESPVSSDWQELRWIHVSACDAYGTVDPRCDRRVSFHIDGPGEIVCVGNGDAADMESFAWTDSHPMFSGSVTAVVRRTGTGDLRLTASTPGLKSAHIRLSENQKRR